MIALAYSRVKEQSKKGYVMRKTSVDEIISFLRLNSELLNRSFGVVRIGIFGSFAKGEQMVSSDIDIVIEMDHNRKSIHTFLKLKRFLEKEMERKIDLGFEQSLKPAIKEKIMKQVIYA